MMPTKPSDSKLNEKDSPSIETKAENPFKHDESVLSLFNFFNQADAPIVQNAAQKTQATHMTDEDEIVARFEYK